MRELFYAIAVAVLAGIVQALLAGLFSHFVCILHIYCA